MPEESASCIHCIIRPRVEHLPNREELRQWIEGKGKLFVISMEKGGSQGPEEWNHYDIWIELKRSCKPSNFKRSLATRFGKDWDEIELKNVKVYGVEDSRRSYQIGYALKEGNYVTNLPEAELVTARTDYERLKVDIAPPKRERWMTANEILLGFREEVRRRQGNQYSILWEEYIKKIKDDFMPMTYYKLNWERTLEWILLTK